MATNGKNPGTRSSVTGSRSSYTSEQEVKRLVKNWQTLLDVMPEMVALIRADGIIEYMNHSAAALIGDMRGRSCKEVFGPLDMSAESGKGGTGVEEASIGELEVEYSFAPFQGYTGEQLAMLVMRDIRQRKERERELAALHANIEDILRQKIRELKESEGVRQQLRREVNLLKKRLQRHASPDNGMIGSSSRMKELRETIDQVADSDATILISGESGTGKELVADLIRAGSNRGDKPFLKVNCNAINDNLLESDLFGYEKGAFTGANARKKGKFEVVDGGSIFLDEIGDISPRMQSSLLRVLQNGELVRVGGDRVFRVDVRIIAATNTDLVKAVQDGKFRLDLFYRLNIINIFIPPLRERKEDIVELVSHFVVRYRDAFRKDIDFLPDSILNKLLLHDWPGNVRELENVIQRAVLTAKNSCIREEDLVFDASPFPSAKNSLNQYLSSIGQRSLKDIMADFEREVIAHSVHKNRGRVQEAAKELNIGKTGLYEKIKRYGISRDF